MKIFSGKTLRIHFKYSSCNSIIDIDSKDLSLEYLILNNKSEKENDLLMFDTDIMLVGLCKKCRGG
ncbi:hypothetical protein SAMN02745163_02325 [Clostridium cavendishii DSM 21758]|uniref:Uncharacterized protein n=1 Tax=Clostridium cavendishii DSM 21758 TaxID=1121302 RepID=A0A1M6KXE6_9CLOT|nr:Fur family transcriptional regulator [Clostridium cavendishii]SHJ63615.1 hypothetical protein SAMN02745163_02325 [Clostridium cavendishii DSM 21758]